MTTPRDPAPLVEAFRAVVCASADFVLELARLFIPRTYCDACRLRSFLVRHTCGRPDYLRRART